jgi:RND family efflux transporter MFP subunit
MTHRQVLTKSHRESGALAPLAQPAPTNTRPTASALGSLLVVLLAAQSCGPAQAKRPASRALPVSWLLPEAASRVPVERRYHGELVPHRTAALAFRRSEPLAALHVTEGQGVEADEVIAELDTRLLLAELEAARARSMAEQAQLDELEAGPRVEQIDLARARVAEWQARLAANRLTAQRLAALVEAEHGSEEAADLAAREAEASAAQLAGAEASLRELLEGTRVEQLDAARARLAMAKAETQRLEADLAQCTLRAPFAGRVAEVLLEVGAVTQPGAPVVRLLESDALEAWIGLPVETLTELRKSQDLLAASDCSSGLWTSTTAAAPSAQSNWRLEVDGRPIPSQLTALLPELDPVTRTQSALFSIPAEISAELVAGQLVTLTLWREEHLNGLWVPADALVRADRGLWAVYVLKDQADGTARLERREVQVLHDQGQRLLVRGLLGAEERVLASGAQRVVAGQVVSPLEAPQLPSSAGAQGSADQGAGSNGGSEASSKAQSPDAGSEEKLPREQASLDTSATPLAHSPANAANEGHAQNSSRLPTNRNGGLR